VDALVKVFDLVLYGLGLGGAEGAVRLLSGVAAQADKVLVGGLLGSSGGDDQARVADAAVDSGLQIVGVADGALAVDLAGQDGLDLLEGLLVHQRLVGAGVEAVAVDDLAGVEGVGQDAVEGLDRDRTLRQASRGRDGQPSAIQLGSQRLERVVAGGVGVKGPGDELGPVRVDGGDVGLAAVTGRGGVAVSQGRLADAAAVACLLAHAFLDLARQVVRVELRDAGHDAVQQHAAGGLVDVLGRGDQAGAELVEPLVEDDVVGAVAGQAVELVDDDVVDGLTAGDGLLQVAQHGLQGRAAGGGARGAALDELLRHAGRNEAAAALSVSSPADSVLDRLQLTAEALSPGDEWRDQRTARRWSDAGMPVIARDLVYFARVSGRLGGETLSVTLGGDAEAGLTVVVDQVVSTALPVRSPLVQIWHYPDGEEPRQVEVDLDRYGSTTVRHPDRTMRRYRLLLDLPAIPPDDGGTADNDVPLLTVSVTGRDAPMRTVFFEDRSLLPPGCRARLACYRSIVTVDVVRDGGDYVG